MVLDLDETLVCSYNASRIPEHLLTGQQRHFVVRYNPGSGCAADIAVFPRPGVRAFLKQLSAFAEVILYTAGNAGTFLHTFPSVLLPGYRLSLAFQNAGGEQ